MRVPISLEIASQEGVAYQDDVSNDAHFHTVWRDKLMDYAGEFTE
ncbi:hypothetical protein RYX51_06075 [Priestia filamentosa]|nr:hypothetical protein RYX51_06075 [Priestia filamentosa]